MMECCDWATRMRSELPTSLANLAIFHSGPSHLGRRIACWAVQLGIKRSLSLGCSAVVGLECEQMLANRLPTMTMGDQDLGGAGSGVALRHIGPWKTCSRWLTGRAAPLAVACVADSPRKSVPVRQWLQWVELFLNNTSLGSAQLGGVRRDDVSSKTPVTMWRVAVNLDATARGEYTLRAIGTDIVGNRRQFASKRLFFPGPGQNCSTPRRRSVR